MRGEFEADAGARARLDEEVDQRLAAQGRHFLDLAGADRLERGGGVEDVRDFRGAQILRSDEVLARPAATGWRASCSWSRSLRGRATPPSSATPSTASKRT